MFNRRRVIEVRRGSVKAISSRDCPRLTTSVTLWLPVASIGGVFLRRLVKSCMATVRCGMQAGEVKHVEVGGNLVDFRIECRVCGVLLGPVCGNYSSGRGLDQKGKSTLGLPLPFFYFGLVNVTRNETSGDPEGVCVKVISVAV